MWPKSVDSKNF